MLVERDYHDAYLLISAVPDAVVADIAAAEHEVRRRAADAVVQLAAGDDDATIAAAHQMVRLADADTQREAEDRIQRAARRIQRRLDA